MSNWLKRNVSRRVAKAKPFLSRLRSDSRGNTLAMAGAALVPIAGMIGSGLDMSRAYMAQAKLQNACDASALAARRVMAGETWTSDAQTEGERFFDFNFPSSTMNSQNVTRTVAQSGTDPSAVTVTASADVPTSVMGLFGKDSIPISVSCNADQDYGNNDIMVVLDVTGSMNNNASGGGGTRIERLRTGAVGLYRALSGATNTRTRFGIVPYSGTVNVGRILRNRDILKTTFYQKDVGGSYDLVGVHIDDTEWEGGNNNKDIREWRLSGEGCVEERPDIGNAAHPIVADTTVTQDDIDLTAVNGSDTARQWGRYDPDEQESQTQWACPNEATRLRTYGSEATYTTAINDATQNVTGGTYHDVGLIWAARLLSQTGMNTSRNPAEFNNVPVAMHIVFLTDGTLDTGGSFYSSYGAQNQDGRMTGSGSNDENHRARFLAACATAKSMGMTIWVIALDVGSTDDIEPCATSSGHFFISDGSDLESVFTRIGQGIGRLRLTT
nr:TadE/TadG family type IV pilus assembly protein [Parasphingopyxis sp. CP4]